MSIQRAGILSAVFGAAVALLVLLIGPLYGGLIAILAFPLVLRRADRAALGWMFAAYIAVAVLSSLVVLALQTTEVSDRASRLVFGLVPLILSSIGVVVTRRRTA